MFRQMQLATIIAIAISASGTIGSVNAGGFKFGGGGSGGGHNNHNHNSHNSHNHSSSGFKIGGSSQSVPRILQSGGANSSGGIKLPGVGTIGQSSNHTNKAPTLINNNNGSKGISVIQSSNALKSFSDKMKSPSVQQKVLGGIGLGIGGSSGNHNHNHSGNHNGNHNHGNHHHCPPLVFTLPVCQPSYCQPCPPIYYPQPYPVAVPVPVPVADPNAVPFDPNAAPFDPNAVPAAPGLPMETKQALEDVVATEVPAVAGQVQPAAATTDVVSKELPLPQIPVGATLTLQGKDLTDKEGQVVLQLGEIALPATIKEWKNDSVTCTLPVLGLTKASRATLHVLKADGKTASTLNCELVTTLPTSIETRPATSADIEAAKYEQ